MVDVPAVMLVFGRVKLPESLPLENSNVNRVYWGEIILCLLTFYKHAQRDIQVLANQDLP